MQVNKKVSEKFVTRWVSMRVICICVSRYVSEQISM